jgi:hypothetical protein
MIKPIVDRLKTGTIKAVVPYGSSKPSAPYIVVKEEKDAIGRGAAYRIFVHMNSAAILDLRKYVRKDLSDLLDGFQLVDPDGNTNYLSFDPFDFAPGLTVTNDDNTISMERVFYMPDIIF